MESWPLQPAVDLKHLQTSVFQQVDSQHSAAAGCRCIRHVSCWHNMAATTVVAKVGVYLRICVSGCMALTTSCCFLTTSVLAGGDPAVDAPRQVLRGSTTTPEI
jgi:hypothetical protein